MKKTIATILGATALYLSGDASEDARFNVEIKDVTNYPCDGGTCYKLSLHDPIALFDDNLHFRSNDPFWEKAEGSK